jgi:putative ATP-dependent endonuclease of the OLD family
LRLGLVEELEAHLHPQAQMQVIEAFQKQETIQLILTTHSPNLASKLKLENLIICNNGYAFPMGSEYTKLRKTDYPFFERFLDVTKSNLFFANGIILIEGVAEELIIPALAKCLHDFGEIDSSLTSKKVSIVTIGNTAFKRYARIFLRHKKPHFKIPISIINDLDLRPKEYANKYGFITVKAKKKHLIETEFNIEEFKNERLKEYGNQCIKLFLSNHWTLEYCIALHPKLNRLLFSSILQSLEEVRANNYQGKKAIKKNIQMISDKKTNVLWQAFTKGKTNEQIAFDMIYKYIIAGKKLSKAVIAMHFANILNSSGITKDDLLIENNPIQYLIDAIKYATGN